jgi:hypothetical protein
MKFFVEIDMDNAAFDPPGAFVEVAKILGKVVADISLYHIERDGLNRGSCRDTNGNVVGNWYTSEEF